jgi:hypothetical protein
MCYSREIAARPQSANNAIEEAEVRNDHNIRSPEERLGGEGHAGEDPFAGDRAGHPDIPPDPSIEVPDADLQDLIQQSDERPEQIENQPKSNSAERRTGTKSV